MKNWIPLVMVAATLSPMVMAQSDNRPTAVVLEERFHTERDEGENVDSPAVWHGPAGQHWLLATAKEGDSILVFDARDGRYLRRVGESGTDAGSLERPNGIAVINDLMLVVERDNQRIQIFSLPGFRSLGSLTHEDLRLPYGLTLATNEDGSYELYVTDNFNPALEGYPPEEELDERIHHFRFRVSDGGLESEHVGTFGDIAGPGLLTKVESLFVDVAHDRLLIADEAFSQRNVKVYNLAGQFNGEIIPSTWFSSEPEGIALYRCGPRSGYWIITDQHPSADNRFQVFDRETLTHVGTFSGAITRNTDGVWLTQTDFGGFPEGAFYPVHDDGSITAIDLAEIRKRLDLDCSLND